MFSGLLASQQRLFLVVVYVFHSSKEEVYCVYFSRLPLFFISGARVVYNGGIQLYLYYTY